MCKLYLTTQSFLFRRDYHITRFFWALRFYYQSEVVSSLQSQSTCAANSDQYSVQNKAIKSIERLSNIVNGRRRRRRYERFAASRAVSAPPTVRPRFTSAARTLFKAAFAFCFQTSVSNPNAQERPPLVQGTRRCTFRIKCMINIF